MRLNSHRDHHVLQSIPFHSNMKPSMTTAHRSEQQDKEQHEIHGKSVWEGTTRELIHHLVVKELKGTSIAPSQGQRGLNCSVVNKLVTEC